MDVKDMRKMQGERTEEELLARIDKILDDARDGHYDLTSTDINDLCEAWECIKHIRTVLAMDLTTQGTIRSSPLLFSC